MMLVFHGVPFANRIFQAIHSADTTAGPVGELFVVILVQNAPVRLA